MSAVMLVYRKFIKKLKLHWFILLKTASTKVAVKPYTTLT